MRLRLAAVTALCWIAATPPGWLPGAEWLILPALAGFFVLVSPGRSLWWAAAVGLAHMLAFSVSIRHIATVAWIVIGLVGTAYYVLGGAWYRALARWLPAPLAFGAAVAGMHLLRAEMPEIPYPHGQPIHALYRWPDLLGAVAWGGEVLGNALLAAVAAASVELWRSWRSAVPEWSAAVRGLACSAAVVGVVTLVPPPAASPGPPAMVSIAAVQPNLPPRFQLTPAGWREALARLIPPTEAVAGRGSARPPALVLWPESSAPTIVVDAGVVAPRVRARPPVDLAVGTRLVLGGLLRTPRGACPAGIVLDHRGTLCGLQAKQQLVPGGEFVPFAWLMPGAVRAPLEDWFAQRLGVPSFVSGRVRPLPATAAGVRFGILLCFDNAFPSIARGQVARGARLLVVLSNEAWFRGGAELDQLEAMTVCRAVELRTPAVRCTVDGTTLAVDAGGHVLARLPVRDPGTAVPPAVLRVELAAGPGAVPPMSWLHDALRWLVWISGLALAWQVLRSWARLLGGRRGRALPPARPVP